MIDKVGFACFLNITKNGISSGINNYINATRTPEIVAPPKKQIDPDLSLGLAALIGETHDH